MSGAGMYRKDGKWLIEEEWIKYHPELKTKDATEIKNQITWSTYTDKSAFDPDIKWLCCSNVMVNIRTGEVKDHSPHSWQLFGFLMLSCTRRHMFPYRTKFSIFTPGNGFR